MPGATRSVLPIARAAARKATCPNAAARQPTIAFRPPAIPGSVLRVKPPARRSKLRITALCCVPFQPGANYGRPAIRGLPVFVNSRSDHRLPVLSALPHLSGKRGLFLRPASVFYRAVERERGLTVFPGALHGFLRLYARPCAAGRLRELVAMSARSRANVTRRAICGMIEEQARNVP